MNGTGNHVQATNRKQWLAFMVLSIFSIFIAIFWREETLLLRYRIVIIVVCSITAVYCFILANYVVTMNDHGVSCYNFGKLTHSIEWAEVETVAEIRDYRINLDNSGNRRLVVIPKGCPTYDSQKWNGAQYVHKFRAQVIWMDSTTQNRKFIEKQYGAIINHC